MGTLTQNTVIVDAHLLGVFGNGQLHTFMLLFGLATFAGGIVLMFQHWHALVYAQDNSREPRVRLFEQRKFRRRATVGCMISVVGTLLAALYWASDPIVVTTLICSILVLVLGILGLAILDFVSVGLQRLGNPDRTHRDKLIQEYLRRRQQSSSGDNGESQG